MNIHDLIGKKIVVSEITLHKERHIELRYIGELVAVECNMIAVNVVMTKGVAQIGCDPVSPPELTWFNMMASTFSSLTEAK